MASDRGVEAGHGGWIMVGRMLVETLMRPVIVEMAMASPARDTARAAATTNDRPTGNRANSDV